MSHRGICLFCGEIIWMGQPMQYLPEPCHDDCIRFCLDSVQWPSPWDEEWNELLEGVEDDC